MGRLTGGRSLARPVGRGAMISSAKAAGQRSCRAGPGGDPPAGRAPGLSSGGRARPSSAAAGRWPLAIRPHRAMQSCSLALEDPSASPRTTQAHGTSARSRARQAGCGLASSNISKIPPPAYRWRAVGVRLVRLHGTDRAGGRRREYNSQTRRAPRSRCPSV